MTHEALTASVSGTTPHSRNDHIIIHLDLWRIILSCIVQGAEYRTPGRAAAELMVGDASNRTSS